MKKIFIAFLVFTSCFYGAFYDMGAGARSIGLGGSFAGIADDSNAMYYNISGIGQMKEMSFTATYSSYFAEFYEGYAAFVVPIYKKGAIGIGWTDTIAPYYNENIITLGYSYPLAKNSYIGAGVRFFMKGYSPDVSTPSYSEFTTMNASGFGLCLSGFTKLGDAMAVGVSLENLNQPDVSIKYQDTVAAVYRMGVSYKIMKDLSAAVQGDMRNGEIKASVGSEYFINAKFFESFGLGDSSIAVRAGYVRGTKSLSNISAGFSLLFPSKLLDLRLDYSFTLPIGYVDGVNSHRITVNLSEPKPLHAI
ncbi:MAG: hypothetical protein A2452_04660 [Candidatus Firestonebacteria bacterium RIFOXYC2_FULL_39_67]|nr:MAG: hypothetical protein A2536_11630 [Candidatus Firestonebacteria bacterium RIFOXYD2_FULL_39_29]OGF53152.1 MAG: hypothetical protein A2497_09315 [Candidatus Firestonebacteria bacterium RifOxyC12_full_39_7]OGF55878.1 MAG: hypothetical protein A2452_04660 [Candidatus Firestonebacteria bacterium RIFOXYC2_FULL_39_67]